MFNNLQRDCPIFFTQTENTSQTRTEEEVAIGYVPNEQGTGYEYIFSWYEYPISIELKKGNFIWKNI